MSQSEEEPDYMSEDILNACVQNDIRPGLLHSHSSQRTHNLQKRKVVTDLANKNRNPKKSMLEQERRDEGLKLSLQTENKGFAMLQKMGYKPGTAIGKQGTGIVEPVPLVVKADRQGLGREQALKDIAAKRALIRERQKATTIDTQSFRMRLSQQNSERQTMGDLRHSQRICEQLDKEDSIAEPEYSWFWPDRVKEKPQESEEDDDKPTCGVSDDDKPTSGVSDDDSDESDSEELSPSEQLEMLTLYLRQSYLYCIWCGTKFNDSEDMSSNCPGLTRDDH